MMNVSRILSSALSILLIFGVALSPTLSFAGGSCSAFCGDTKNAIANLIKDPKCKADASCVSCVGNTLGSSQVANYCTAYQSTAKSEKKQLPVAILYDTTAAVCLVSCGLQMSSLPPTVALGQTLARVCTGLGLGAAAFDIISALTSNDPTGAVMGAIGAAPGVGTKMTMLTKGMTGLTTKLGDKAASTAKNQACMSGAIYTLLAVTKHMSLSKMKKAAQSQCDVIANFGQGANAAVQSCQLGNIAAPPSTGDAGLFAATAESFAAPTLNDGLNQLGVNAADQFIKDMRGDLKNLEDLGKYNFGDLAKKADAGAPASDIIKSFGLGKEQAVMVDNLEARLLAGEKIPGLDALGGGYSGGGTGTELASVSNTSEMNFNVSTGEGVQSLDIERVPASEGQSGLVDDGDILHSAFGGTIFDIVSLRIKEQKGKYAEAEPEGRMNRAFNGFSNRERQPASKSLTK